MCRMYIGQQYQPGFHLVHTNRLCSALDVFIHGTLKCNLKKKRA